MMATTEERMKILKMIDEGKISAEEGAKLLSALSDSRNRAMTGAGLSRGTGNARWLRVKSNRRCYRPLESHGADPHRTAGSGT